MFKLVNEHGNCIKIVKSEHKKQQLIKDGFREVKEKKVESKKSESKKAENKKE